MLIKKKDIKSLVGRFVVELNDNQINIDITKSKDPEFWFEKRISFISVISTRHIEKAIRLKYTETKIGMNGFYYQHSYKSENDFVDFFNGTNRDRFCRLMTKKELKWLNKLMIKRNKEK